MRAGSMLEWLAGRFDVWLLVVPVNGLPQHASALAARFCERVETLKLSKRLDPIYSSLQARLPPREADRLYAKPLPWRFATDENVSAAASVYSGMRFDAVHVFRLFMTPYAEPYLTTEAGSRPLAVLDLDEYQSRTRSELAALYQTVGMEALAKIEEAQAVRFAEMEARLIPRFDAVGLAARRDADAVANAHRAPHVHWAANTIRPVVEAPTRSTKDHFVFLFVGTLDWFPNEDAVVYFCREVLPLVRTATDREIRIEIAGGGASKRLRELKSIPEVRLRGWVSDLASYYEGADAVVAPVRAGGGTRIKILEAAAHCVPVVATTKAAEGLDLLDGQSILIGDSAAEFAQRCLDLMRDSFLAERLTTEAARVVRRDHSPDRLEGTLSRCYDAVLKHRAE